VNIKSIVTTGIFIGVLLAGGALAQTWAPPAEIAPTKPSVQATPPTAAPSTASPAKATASHEDARKAKSKECSAEADAKGLHGKARKRFRDKCKQS
jgi:hypothetical protein